MVRRNLQLLPRSKYNYEQTESYHDLLIST